MTGKLYVYCPAIVAVGIAASLRAGDAVPFEQVVIDPSQIAYARVIVDLDGDGLNDVVAITSDRIRWYPAPNFNAVNLLQLSIAQHGYDRFRADDLEFADIDGDGDPDLVTRIGDSGDINGSVVWFKNPRPSQPVTATWSKHDIGATVYVKDIEIDDFDGDGKRDVVTREHNATQIWFQNSPTNWTKKAIAHASHEGMDVGDLDNDGDPDIVLNGFWLQTPSSPRTGSYQSHTIDVMWFNQGEGWPNNACRVVVADISGNGKLDVLLCQSERTGFPVAWYSASNPTGSWQQHIVTSQLDYCHTLHAADFNDDGFVDVLAGGMPQSAQGGLRLYLSNGAGGWSTEVIQTLGAYSGEIGDLQNDGDLDVINVRNWNEAPTEIWENRLRDETCPGDMVSNQTFQPPPDGMVNGADLAYLLGAWGNNPGSPADIVNSATFQPPPDGVVDGADLATLLGAWGSCG
jgi:hypothetical protein